MAQVLVRNLDDDVVERLKQRAKEHDRSLQAEVKSILTEAAGISFAQARQLSKYWRKKLTGRSLPDTTDILRKDRRR